MHCGLISAARRRTSGPVTDPNFSSVKLLVGFEGANGSTTFTDESASPHTLTANGGAQITTSQSKFGASSGAFDGTGDFISAAASSDWRLPFGEFTVEGWFRFLVKQSSQALIGQWDNAGTNGNSCWFLYVTGGNLRLRLARTGSTFDLDAAFVPTLGQWYHLQADRDAGGTSRLYANGSMLGSTTAQNGIQPNNSTALLTLGRIGASTTFSSFDFNGNMDEVRLTPGVARCGSDGGFTVPTAAFPRS
jgi:hypothetical protein